jgi:hypothetical protein
MVADSGIKCSPRGLSSMFYLFISIYARVQKNLKLKSKIDAVYGGFMFMFMFVYIYME